MADPDKQQAPEVDDDDDVVVVERYATTEEDKALLAAEVADDDIVEVTRAPKPRDKDEWKKRLDDPLDEGPTAPGRGGSDFLAGLANPMNVQNVLPRIAEFLGALDEEDAQRVSDYIAQDVAARRQRSPLSYGAGQAVGDVAASLIPGAAVAKGAKAASGVRALANPVGRALLGSTGQAAATGAITGAASEAARTGDLDDIARGAVGGAVGGAAVPKIGEWGGKLFGKVGNWLAQRTPKGRIAERSANIARTVAADLKAVAGLDELPPPSMRGTTYADALKEVSPRVRQIVSMGGDDAARALREAAKGATTDVLDASGRSVSSVQLPGNLGAQDISDAVALLALRETSKAAPAAPRLLDPVISAGGWAGRKGQAAAQKMAKPIPRADSFSLPVPPLVGAGTSAGIGPAFPTYAEMVGDTIESVGDVAEDPHFDAFRAAAESPVIRQRRGLSRRLVDMLSGWAAGDRPPQQEIEAMSHQLNEVPGLEYARIDPLRQVADDEEE